MIALIPAGRDDGGDDDEELEVFVVYEHPPDFPKAFVIRRWFIAEDQSGQSWLVPEVRIVAPTLHMARFALGAFIRAGLVRYDKRDMCPLWDDPKIVEVWA